MYQTVEGNMYQVQKESSPAFSQAMWLVWKPKLYLCKHLACGPAAYSLVTARLLGEIVLHDLDCTGARGL